MKKWSFIINLSLFKLHPSDRQLVHPEKKASPLRLWSTITRNSFFMSPNYRRQSDSINNFLSWFAIPYNSYYFKFKSWVFASLCKSCCGTSIMEIRFSLQFINTFKSYFQLNHLIFYLNSFRSLFLLFYSFLQMLYVLYFLLLKILS